MIIVILPIQLTSLEKNLIYRRPKYVSSFSREIAKKGYIVISLTVRMNYHIPLTYIKQVCVTILGKENVNSQVTVDMRMGFQS